MSYETITKTFLSKMVLKKRGVGFARLHLQVEPAPNREVHLISEIPPSTVSAEFIEHCWKGVKQALEEGVIEGYPIQGIKITLIFAEDHPEDSTNEAFRMAGYNFFQFAFHSADPVVIED
ncbi:MAG: hypothetical protein P8M30_13815 [Planctomycetaceae bacterium]|jgi:elongation factor G|nr:hypothetical protein [Planctomycetaceae bacterium]MDG2390381.1 hypothetical protein [Planctomycetaceae bacterium]